MSYESRNRLLSGGRFCTRLAVSAAGYGSFDQRKGRMGDRSVASAWDEEYRRGGIPSSYRDAPAAAVRWALDSWPWLGCDRQPVRALDVGCGTARNAAYLASEGIQVTAFDSSTAAVAIAERRMVDAALDVDLLVHDLQAGLPAADGEIDLVLDVFVYTHQIDPSTRSGYRKELQRILADEGRVIIVVAEPEDGYYGSCPPSQDAAEGPHAVLDPVLGLRTYPYRAAASRAA